MRSYAILIDAGFLKRKLGSRHDPMSVEKVRNFLVRLQASPALTEMRLHRVYYYDAPPLDAVITRPLNGGTWDLGKTNLAKTNRALLKNLAKEPFFAIREGELHFRGWKISRKNLLRDQDSVSLSSDALVPDVQQKGVDMRIGLDIATLTLKKQVRVIVLVTGDSDFVPAMKFARKEGTQLFLVRLAHAVMPALITHADLDLRIEEERE